MKKILSMTLVFATMLLMLSACSKDDDKIKIEEPPLEDEENKKPSLVDTEWKLMFVGRYIIIKFTSETDVEGYFADSDYVIEGKVSSGTYSFFDGNKVTFNDFIIDDFGVSEYKYKTGEIAGSSRSSMKVTYYHKYTSSSDWGPLLPDTFSKR